MAGRDAGAPRRPGVSYRLIADCSFSRQDVEAFDYRVRPAVVGLAGHWIGIELDAHDGACGHFAGDLIIAAQAAVRASRHDGRASPFGILPGGFEGLA